MFIFDSYIHLSSYLVFSLFIHLATEYALIILSVGFPNIHPFLHFSTSWFCIVFFFFTCFYHFLPAHLSICPSVCRLSVFLIFYLPIHPSIYLFVCLSLKNETMRRGFPPFAKLHCFRDIGKISHHAVARDCQFCIRILV